MEPVQDVRRSGKVTDDGGGVGLRPVGDHHLHLPAPAPALLQEEAGQRLLVPLFTMANTAPVSPLSSTVT